MEEISPLSLLDVLSTDGTSLVTERRCILAKNEYKKFPGISQGAQGIL